MQPQFATPAQPTRRFTFAWPGMAASVPPCALDDDGTRMRLAALLGTATVPLPPLGSLAVKPAAIDWLGDGGEADVEAGTAPRVASLTLRLVPTTASDTAATATATAGDTRQIRLVMATNGLGAPAFAFVGRTATTPPTLWVDASVSAAAPTVTVNVMLLGPAGPDGATGTVHIVCADRVVAEVRSGMRVCLLPGAARVSFAAHEET